MCHPMSDSPRSVPPGRRSQTPTFSVVVPTHDRASTLPRAIRSVLRQTRPDFELIVVDDGSTDETPDVVRRFDDQRIRSERLAGQRGANAARNAGIDMARGELVSFLDSDDELHPTHLERVLEAFREGGRECSGVVTGSLLVPDGEPGYGSSPGEGVVSWDEVRDAEIAGGFTCTTFRATVFEDVRLDEDLECWQDRDLFLRLVRRGHRIRCLDEVLVTRHLGEVRIGNDLDSALRGTRRYLEKHGDVLTDRGLSRLHYFRAFSHARAGQLRSAREEFRRCIRFDPTRWSCYAHLVAALHPTTFRALLRMKRGLRALRRRRTDASVDHAA